MKFTEHLDELRSRLKVVAISFFVIFIIVLLFPSNPAYSLQNPGQYLGLTFVQNTIIASFLHRVVADLLPNPCPLGLPPTAGCWNLIAANGIGEGMEIYFVAALLLSVVLDMPVMAYETYKFIDPALSENERKFIYPFVISTTLLFAVGILFGYLAIAKFLIVALAPFFVATGVSFQVGASSFYYVVFLIIGATGVSFTSPVFVYTLIRLRVLDADFFSKNRVIIWFLIWVVTGLFLTPDGGPLLDVVIFIPIVAMVEIAVWLARRGVRGLHPKSSAGGVGSPSRPGPGGVVCPSCGRTLARPMLFCDNCGKSVA